jgi:predicted esterase YcpF (UPF0227 family)
MALSHLLYLHGFRSSPLSTKARMVAAKVAAEHPDVTWWCPQLPPSPRQAMDLVLQGIDRWPRDAMGVIGSSLGGDEVLDWREMTARYAGARIKLLEGGDHALSDFDDHIDEVLAFLLSR